METISAILPSKSTDPVDGNVVKADTLAESDEFYAKWSGPFIIGAFVPALFAVISVVGGAITLGSWKGQCGYPLQCSYFF
jgi:hypothetical protein